MRVSDLTETITRSHPELLDLEHLRNVQFTEQAQAFIKRGGFFFVHAASVCSTATVTMVRDAIEKVEGK